MQCNKIISKNLKSIEELKFILRNHTENVNLYSESIKTKAEINTNILYKSISTTILYAFQNIKAMDLQKNNIGARSILFLQSFIRKTTNLIHLNLSYNNICCEGTKHFSDFLRENKSLETINLECNSIGDEGFCYFFTVINNFHNFMKIIKLSLNQVSCEGLKHMVNTLEEPNSLNFVLFDLKFNNIVIDDLAEKNSLEKQKIFIWNVE